eukprot:CAMPEP_0206457402 /NCGR_PEP_ID=MMETSP0324_2-20121206/22939_1 /ASSEMBLY_ACC=CAM_ASM_000836 /TAXON_ID=2866 /ORGANISM="Crypthecodinium cohnii, Strain Seligo" /LENGTH=152 /DNA_ID=CAMNT_0053928515 /DNA_START=700 /DNA_END=1159 /DNA_ORIENTATION=-
MTVPKATSMPTMTRFGLKVRFLARGAHLGDWFLVRFQLQAVLLGGGGAFIGNPAASEARLPSFFGGLNFVVVATLGSAVAATLSSQPPAEQPHSLHSAKRGQATIVRVRSLRLTGSKIPNRTPANDEYSREGGHSGFSTFVLPPKQFSSCSS